MINPENRQTSNIRMEQVVLCICAFIYVRNIIYIFMYITNKIRHDLKENMKGYMAGFGGKIGNEKIT